MKYFQERLDELISAIRHRERLLKPKLLKMKADLEKDKKNIKYCHAEDIDLRMRKHHIEVLVKKLYDVLENFAAAQEDYRKRATSKTIIFIFQFLFYLKLLRKIYRKLC